MGLLACGRLGFSTTDDSDSTDPDAGDAVPLIPCTGDSLDCTDALACRSFESGTLDPWDWLCDGDNFQCGPPIPEVDLSVVSTPACNGSNVFRAATQGGPGSRQNAYVGHNFPEQKSFYARAVIRRPSDTVVDDGLPFFMVPVSQNSGGGVPRLGFGREQGEMRLLLRGEPTFFAADIPLDEWTCVEFHLTEIYAEVWVNGESVLTKDGPTVEAGTIMDKIALGIIASSDDGETELFFDDFAVSTERLGCKP